MKIQNLQNQNNTNFKMAVIKKNGWEKTLSKLSSKDLSFFEKISLKMKNYHYDLIVDKCGYSIVDKDGHKVPRSYDIYNIDGYKLNFIDKVKLAIKYRTIKNPYQSIENNELRKIIEKIDRYHYTYKRYVDGDNREKIESKMFAGFCSRTMSARKAKLNFKNNF